jgi:hypothetical protein
MIKLLYHEFWNGHHKRIGEFIDVPLCAELFEAKSSPEENQRPEVL